MNIKKIIREVIDNNPYYDFMDYDDDITSENLDLCKLVSPRGSSAGGYMSNEEAINLINRIKLSGDKHLTGSKKIIEFNKVIEDFKKQIIQVDTNLDTIDTYLHKLRDIVNC